jgi:hypothetical protein
MSTCLHHPESYKPHRMFAVNHTTAKTLSNTGLGGRHSQGRGGSPTKRRGTQALDKRGSSITCVYYLNPLTQIAERYTLPHIMPTCLHHPESYKPHRTFAVEHTTAKTLSNTGLGGRRSQGRSGSPTRQVGYLGFGQKGLIHHLRA